MKSNGLLKWLMIPVVLAILFMGFKLISGKGNTDGYTLDDGTRLTAEEMKALGIEGDTPRDTVATLVGQVKQMRTELKTALDNNQTQKSENDRLRLREQNVDQRINTALEEERARQGSEREQYNTENQRTHSLLQDLQQRLENNSRNNDLPIGLGLEPVDGKVSGEIRWFEPSDAPKETGNRSSLQTPSSFPSSFGAGSDSSDNDTSLQAGERIRHEATTGNKPEPKPVYTIPANATLMGSVAMTALIGRVPVDGTVNDPYPFKVLIGPDNLTANGIDLPDVSGAVLSGTASGDWTLSCVRGQINSITFVFDDGTIRTIPPATSANSRSNSGSNNRSATTGGLGWISDPHGIPCVSGERRSNAQQYLSTQTLITAAGAGAASLIKDDSGQYSYMGSDGSMSSGSMSGSDAMGQILMGGVKDMSSWVNKLYGEAFAAVYVQPGAAVAVHIDQELAIDYDDEGRRVNHNTGGNHANELD